MKKLFSFLLVLGAIMCATTSCDKDKDDVVEHSLNKTSLTLKVGETAKLTYTGGDCTWSSSNELVASVKDGEVEAKLVGKAIIYANDKTCEVTVKPNDTSFAEPYLNWGASKATVKSYMSGYTLNSEDTNSLTYKGKGNVAAYGYNFSSGALIASIMGVNLENAVALTNFILERYAVVYMDESGSDLEVYLINPEKDMALMFILSGSSAGLMYIPYEASSSIKGTMTLGSTQIDMSKMNRITPIPLDIEPAELKAKLMPKK